MRFVRADPSRGEARRATRFSEQKQAFRRPSRLWHYQRSDFDVELRRPPEMGDDGGTNPERPFAVGFAA